MGRKRILTLIGIIVLAILAFAWIDGGREEQRLIETPVDLPENAGLGRWCVARRGLPGRHWR